MSPVLGRSIAEGLGLKWVPILEGEYYVPEDMEEFKVFADGNSAVNSQVLREGLVLRDPITNLSFKNISRKYMLKHS